MYKEKIVDIETGIESFREYTEAEVAEVKQSENELKLYAEAFAAKQNQRKVALAKLEALGFDESDLTALGL